MEKLKRIVDRMSTSVREAFEKFPITIIIVYALTIINLINLDFKMYIHIMIIGVLWSLGTFLVEALISNHKSLKEHIGVIIALIVAVFLDRVIKMNLDQLWMYRFICAYIIIIFLSGIYVLLRKSGSTLENYFLKVNLKLYNASLIYFVYILGISFIFSIIAFLLFENISLSIAWKIFVSLTGFYFIPAFLNSYAGKEENLKFNKTLVLRVLLPLLAISILVIYLYILKIFLLNEVPKNAIFRILAILFVAGLYIYFVARNCEGDGKTTDTIIKAIPLAFIPLVILQVYSIGIRIFQYGFTASRYMALAFVVLEIATIFLILYKNSKFLYQIILVVNVVIFITFVSPLNFTNISCLSQKKVLDEYVENGIDFEDLDEEDKMRYSNVYEYLKIQPDYEKYLNEDLSEDDIYQFENYTNHGNYYENDEGKIDKKEYVSCYRDTDGLNIEDYRKIYKFSLYDTNAKKCVVDNDSDIYVTCNFEDYMNTLIEENEKSSDGAEKAFKRINTIKTNDVDYDLYITDVYITYSQKSKEIIDFNVSGYILRKNIIY